MAPKRKSVSSRNPLRSGASSFADTTPFSVRFCDENLEDVKQIMQFFGGSEEWLEYNIYI